MKNQNEKTIEQKAAEAILQKTEKIVIGGETYEVAPPSVATLILVSEICSQIPSFDSEKLGKSGEAIDFFVNTNVALAEAKKYKRIAEVLSVMILGAKGLTETKKLFGIIPLKQTDRKTPLAEKILLETSPQELSGIMFSLFSKMQINDFFLLITSLTETNRESLTNLLKRTI